MKGCPVCNKKYQDDIEFCEKCNIELMNWKIAESIYLYGVERIKNSHPKEYKIVSNYKKENTSYVGYVKPNIISSKQESFKTVKQPPQQQNIPKCPTCGSTNVQPISATKKAMGFILAGIFSCNFGKSFECKNCKYKW